MPIFDYVCPKCGEEVERLVSYANQDEQHCKCDAEDPVRLERVDKIHATGLQFKGRWYKTTRGY